MNFHNCVITRSSFRSTATAESTRSNERYNIIKIIEHFVGGQLNHDHYEMVQQLIKRIQ